MQEGIMTNLEGLSDNELIEISKNGQRENAYETIYKRHYEGLYRFAIKLSKNKEIAKDLVGESFFKVINALENGKYRNKNFKAWIYTILYHNHIDSLRRKEKDNEIISELSYFKDSYIENSEKNYINKNRDKMIAEEFSKISEKLRVAFEMHLNGYKYKEIALELNEKIDTIKPRIYHAKRKMREKLLAEYPEFCEQYA